MIMSVNIYDYDGKLIKSFNPLNKPIKMFRDEYIFKHVLDNIYDNLLVVDIDKENIKLMNEKQLKEYGKILKRKYKQNKKMEEIKTITKENEEIIKDDPTNINIVDFNDNILKIITLKFKKSKFILYKPFIEKEFPNMFDVVINDTIIKIMNDEQFKNYKREQHITYREKNKKKLIEYDKKYNEEHKKESKLYYKQNNEKYKQYREEHKEEINLKQKIYREEHKEEINLKKKIYREEHKEESKLYYKQKKEKLLIKT